MVRVRLLKSYKHENKQKAWTVGRIVNCSPQLASDLIHRKIAENYSGGYPPKKVDKLKMELNKLK